MKIFAAEKLSPNRYKTKEGYLICTNDIIARTGYQEYLGTEIGLDSAEVFKVYRPENEVFSDATIASFENKPLTMTHPDVNVNSENHKELSFGYVRDVHRDGDNLVCNIVVTDEAAINAIEQGELEELSCGYDCEIIMRNGQYVQHSIRGNHVALVEAGRAGNAKIRDEAIKDGYSLTEQEEKTLSALPQFKVRQWELDYLQRYGSVPFSYQRDARQFAADLKALGYICSVTKEEDPDTTLRRPSFGHGYETYHPIKYFVRIDRKTSHDSAIQDATISNIEYDPTSLSKIKKEVESYKGDIDGLKKHLEKVCSNHFCKFATLNELRPDKVEVCVYGRTGAEWFVLNNFGVWSDVTSKLSKYLLLTHFFAKQTTKDMAIKDSVSEISSDSFGAARMYGPTNEQAIEKLAAAKEKIYFEQTYGGRSHGFWKAASTILAELKRGRFKISKVYDHAINDAGNPSTIAQLIKEEEDAIDSYSRAIEAAETEAEKTVYQHIMEEEIEHVDELKKLEQLHLHDSDDLLTMLHNAWRKQNVK